MLTIDKGIPMPSRHLVGGRGGRPLSPFGEVLGAMDVGDSVLAPVTYSPDTLRSVVTRHGKRLGRSFAVRMTPEGRRVWRTA